MAELMLLPLNMAESTALVKFLNESDDPHSHEYLVMYYLLHCDFFEAEKANEKLSRLLSRKSELNIQSIQERASDRNALVEIFVSVIPETSKRLVWEVEHFPVRLKQNEPPQPLSMRVATKAKTLKKVTYSDILLALVDGSSSCIAQLPGKARKLVIASQSSSVSSTKRSLPCPTDVSMPAKRTRLLDNAVFKVTPLSNRKMPRHLAGDIVTLLQTPPVHRKPRTPETLKPTHKPVPILKKRIDMDFPQDETPPIFPKSDTSDEEDVDNKESNKDAPDTESRHILFDIPNAQLTTHQEQIVTPRASLRKSPDLVIQRNVLLPKGMSFEIKRIFAIDSKSILPSDHVLKSTVTEEGNVEKSDPAKVETGQSEDLFNVPQESKGKSSRRTFIFGKKTTPHSTFDSNLTLRGDTSGQESISMMDFNSESFLSSEIAKHHEGNISSAKSEVSHVGVSSVFNETMKSERTMLVKTDVSGSSVLDSFTRKSSRTSNRKFIFSKTSKKAIQNAKKEIVDMDVETFKSEAFLKSDVSETYEEFSSSLSKSDDGVSSKYKLAKSTQSKKGRAAIRIRNPSSAQKSAKKKKEKAKTAGRVFTFAEPTCPASPEILEALADYAAEEPLPPILFSPPLTRGRLRQMTLIDSSFMSSVLESSPRAEPPVVPLLVGRNLRASRKTPKRKTPLKKKHSLRADLSILDSIRESPGKNSSMRHSMVLRNRHSP